MSEARVAEHDTSVFLEECLDLYYQSDGAKFEVDSKKGRHRLKLVYDADFIDFLVDLENKSDDLREFVDDTKKMLKNKKNNMRGFLVTNDGVYSIDHKLRIIDTLLAALQENLKYIQNIKLDDNDDDDSGCDLCLRPRPFLRSESFGTYKCNGCQKEICLSCYTKLEICPYCRDSFY